MATHHHGHHHEDMLSVEEARDKILSQFGVLNAQNFLITEALGLVTSDQVRSEINIPPLDNSAMDGYAVMSRDVSTATYEHPVMLEILETIPAGSLPTKPLKTGAASRIMTGAPVPEHCDAVIPFEDTTEKDFSKSGRLTEIGIRTSVSPGTNVRVKGKDIKEADSVLEEGHVITAATIGVLASMGMSHVRAIRKPVVSILSTGNELLSPGEKPAEGKIFDSNSSSIMASVIQLGAIPRYIGIARDEMGSVREKLREAMESDLVISSAGVSKGDYDMVKDVMSEHGDLQFWSVRMRPAKPLAFGTLNRGSKTSVPLIGLPGNPVSSLVAFEQFCRPAILKMMGKTNLHRPTIQAVLKDSIVNYDSRRVYARVIVEQTEDGYTAKTTGHQDSNILTSMVHANGLAICPEEEESKDPGDIVTVIMLDD
ncbi:MAG: molybdopterin molybdotransferase MoeA [SAR202 cluster bacterium]|jgi:molybdopterin molybdotransferase|nr:molybdopterin molybdotransferase MoeA [SAR202 cluster bacterium]|tara:strand:- start:30165 stop:31442 length:1278 start_codon:yes stop_codon:yes gene_type:complete